MRRYNFLNKEDVFEALNRLRSAFLAARDGNEVEDIINGILTHDEKIRIGRRIQISEYLINGSTVEEITHDLKVGRSTVDLVAKLLSNYPHCFELLKSRNKKVEKEYKKRRHHSVGSSKLIFKRKEYTGFKRKDINR